MTGRRFSLLKLCAVVVLAFVLGEAATRVTFAFSGEAPPHLNRSLQQEWDWATPILERGAYEDGGGSVFHPRLGYRMAPHRDEDGVRTNSVGLRSDREFAPTPPPGVTRILLIGDSYTFGYRVANEETWGARLEARLAASEVLNLGVPGYGTDQAILAYEEIGAEFEPDVVVLGFFVRDFFRNEVAFRGYAKPRFDFDPDGELELFVDHIVPPEELSSAYLTGTRRVGGWNYSYLTSWIGSAFARSPFMRGRLGEDRRLVRLMGALLERFRDETERRGAEPFLLILPERLDKHLGTHWETVERRTLQQAEALGLPTLSMTERFQHEEADVPELPLNPDHLSVRGNEVVAEELARALQEADLVPSSD